MSVSKPALLVVDVQNDFCPGGALAVEDGDRVIEPLNRIIEEYTRTNKPVFFSRDWHTKDTKHFAKYGGKWPVHCVQRTRGAEFHPDLTVPKGAYILNKGVDPSQDGYSAFEGRSMARSFDELLIEFGVNILLIGGLATDYCVKNSVLDALKKDYLVNVYLLTDACKAVNLKPCDGAQALDEMGRAGALFSSTYEFLK
jgi:nicotinamidase/pyrazinamidase